MFGVSFLEIALVGLVALMVVGPEKLPEMMRTAGEWLGRLRRLTSDMRVQTGIDDILREEGIDGVGELRTLLRGERGLAARRGSTRYGQETYSEPPDLAVEFPTEGPDAQGALPDDLLVSPNVPAEEGQADPADPAPPAEEKKQPSFIPPSNPPPEIRESDAPPTAAKTNKIMTNLPSSIPPPPATPRRIPPRAITHPETPISKSELKVTISEPPPARPKPPRPDSD